MSDKENAAGVHYGGLSFSQSETSVYQPTKKKRIRKKISPPANQEREALRNKIEEIEQRLSQLTQPFEKEKENLQPTTQRRPSEGRKRKHVFWASKTRHPRPSAVDPSFCVELDSPLKNLNNPARMGLVEHDRITFTQSQDNQDTPQPQQLTEVSRERSSSKSRQFYASSTQLSRSKQVRSQQISFQVSSRRRQAPPSPQGSQTITSSQNRQQDQCVFLASQRPSSSEITARRQRPPSPERRSTSEITARRPSQGRRSTSEITARRTSPERRSRSEITARRPSQGRRSTSEITARRTSPERRSTSEIAPRRQQPPNQERRTTSEIAPRPRPTYQQSSSLSSTSSQRRNTPSYSQRVNTPPQTVRQQNISSFFQKRSQDDDNNEGVGYFDTSHQSRINFDKQIRTSECFETTTCEKDKQVATSPTVAKRKNTKCFESGPWLSLCHSYNLDAKPSSDYDQNSQYTVCKILHVPANGHKISRMPVVVTKINFLEKGALAILADPTGEIPSEVHQAVLRNASFDFVEGCAILLKDFTVFRSHWNREGYSSHSVIVTLCNIEKVFSPSTVKPSEMPVVLDLEQDDHDGIDDLLNADSDKEDSSDGDACERLSSICDARGNDAQFVTSVENQYCTQVAGVTSKPVFDDDDDDDFDFADIDAQISKVESHFYNKKSEAALVVEEKQFGEKVLTAGGAAQVGEQSRVAQESSQARAAQISHRVEEIPDLAQGRARAAQMPHREIPDRPRIAPIPDQPRVAQMQDDPKATVSAPPTSEVTGKNWIDADDSDDDF